MSFLMMALGSYGLPRNLDPFATSYEAVSDLVPDDRIQIVKPYPTANDADICMQGKHQVPAKGAPSNAHVTDDTHQPPPRHEDAVHVAPHSLELPQEILVVVDMPKLIRMVVIPFEIPVRRRRHNEMHRVVGEERQVPCITVDKSVGRPLHAQKNAVRWPTRTLAKRSTERSAAGSENIPAAP